MIKRILLACMLCAVTAQAMTISKKEAAFLTVGGLALVLAGVAQRKISEYDKAILATVGASAAGGLAIVSIPPLFQAWANKKMHGKDRTLGKTLKHTVTTLGFPITMGVLSLGLLRFALTAGEECFGC